MQSSGVKKNAGKLLETRVWENMQLDRKLTPSEAKKRKATQQLLEGMEQRLVPHI